MNEDGILIIGGDDVRIFTMDGRIIINCDIKISDYNESLPNEYINKIIEKIKLQCKHYNNKKEVEIKLNFDDINNYTINFIKNLCIYIADDLDIYSYNYIKIIIKFECNNSEMYGEFDNFCDQKRTSINIFINNLEYIINCSIYEFINIKSKNGIINKYKLASCGFDGEYNELNRRYVIDLSIINSNMNDNMNEKHKITVNEINNIEYNKINKHIIINIGNSDNCTLSSLNIRQINNNNNNNLIKIKSDTKITLLVDYEEDCRYKINSNMINNLRRINFICDYCSGVVKKLDNYIVSNILKKLITKDKIISYYKYPNNNCNNNGNTYKPYTGSKIKFYKTSNFKYINAIINNKLVNTYGLTLYNLLKLTILMLYNDFSSEFIFIFINYIINNIINCDPVIFDRFGDQVFG